MELNRKQKVDNQFPESWTDKTVLKTLDRFIKEKVNKSPGKDLHQVSFTETPSIMVVQYRGNENLMFANKVRNIKKAPSIVFNTRKLEICLPPLKFSLSRELKSNVFYNYSCCGWSSTSYSNYFMYFAQPANFRITICIAFKK